MGREWQLFGMYFEGFILIGQFGCLQSGTMYGSLCVFLSVHLSVSVCLSVCLSVCMSVCLSCRSATVKWLGRNFSMVLTTQPLAMYCTSLSEQVLEGVGLIPKPSCEWD